MAYNIVRTDPNNTAITVEDNTVNEYTNIDLVGRNKTNYGEIIATTQIHMLENFASATPPDKPLPGQLHYDTSLKRLNVNTGTTDGESTWSSLILTGGSGGETNLGTPEEPFGTIYVRNIGEADYPAEKVYAENVYANLADLAERFAADKEYVPGTVVSLGGEYEITSTSGFADVNVLGVIADAPAFIMNSEAGDDTTHPTVAMAGRVHTNVIGKINKGDRIISSEIEGVGIAVSISTLDSLSSYCVIGRALEDKEDNDAGKVWIVVGAK